jgi:hypothetical protein
MQSTVPVISNVLSDSLSSGVSSGLGLEFPKRLALWADAAV